MSRSLATTVCYAATVLLASVSVPAQADDYEEYYCPAVEWNWGDGTVSESAPDCEPYAPGVSQIRRRFTGSHTYKRAGAYRVLFRLKHRDKVLTSQTVTVRLLG